MVGHLISVNNYDIFGYSRYVEFYNSIIAGAKDDELFVELGSFLGQSTCALGFFVKQSGKRIRIDAVDIFELSDFSDDLHYDVVKQHGGSMLEAFKHNIKQAQVADVINIVQAESLVAANRYEDRSISYLMIDASHKYADVVDDIRAWYPKVKLGGIISGDDYDLPDVAEAVKDTLGEVLIFQNSTWFLQKNKLSLT